MNVGELIERLSHVDPTWPVYVSAESGHVWFEIDQVFDALNFEPHNEQYVGEPSRPVVGLGRHDY